MAIYDRFILTAKSLIDKFGQDATLRQKTVGVPPDPNKDWEKGPSVVTDYATKMVFLNEKRKDLEAIINIKEELVAEGYIYALVPDIEGVEVTIKDVIIRDGKQFKFRYVRPLRPASQLIFWKIGITV